MSHRRHKVVKVCFKPARGIHVAHVVIDGAVDGAFIRERMPDLDARLARDEVLKADEIARNDVWLYR